MKGWKTPVQHHYAHILSAMAENRILKQDALGIAFDGTGYGDDGNLWGSEFIIVRDGEYCRRGHFKYVPMPGGERAVIEPARMAFSYLYDAFGEDALKIDIGLSDRTKTVLKKMIEKRINTPMTCGLGRLFDAVSALLRVCLERTFEGEPAIMLEMIAADDADGSYPFNIFGGKEHVVDAAPIIRSIVEDLKRNTPASRISMRFHETIARLTVELAETICFEEETRNIVLSGGVFQNRILSSRIKRLVEERGFKAFFNNMVPTNDGGLSLGQAVAVGLKAGG